MKKLFLFSLVLLLSSSAFSMSCDPSTFDLNSFQDNGQEIVIHFCQNDPVAPGMISDSLFKYASDIGIDAMSASLVYFENDGGSQGDLTTGSGSEPSFDTNTSGSTRYWVAQEVDGCLGNARRLRLRVRGTPEITLTATTDLICPGDMIDLASYVASAVLNVRNYDFYDADPSSNSPFQSTGNNGNANGRLPNASVDVTPGGDACYWIIASRTFGNVQNLTCYSDPYKIAIDVDTDAPTFTCPTGVNRFDTDPGVCEWTMQGTSLDPMNIMDDHGWTATNDYNNGNTLMGATFSKGKTTVTWTVEDDCGNSATCSYDVRVRDREMPAFDNCPASPPPYVVPFCSTGMVHTWPTLTAMDNCTKANKIAISVFPLSGSTFPLGTTTVTATATDKAGNVGTCTFDVTVEEDCDPLPPGMSNNDIGNTGGVDGKVCYDAGTGTFEIKTSGSGIPNAANNADGLHMVYRNQYDATNEVVARVVQQPTNNYQDRVGVMIRDNGSSSAASVACVITGDNKTMLVSRAGGFGSTSLTIMGPTLPGPLWPGPTYWVRLQKVGASYTGAVSPDGINWTTIGTLPSAISGGYRIGIAATAGTPGQVIHYKLDNLSISGSLAPRLGSTSAETLAVTSFPNPVQGQLNVQIAAPAAGQVQMTLRNALGQELLVQRFEAGAEGMMERQLDMSDLAAGVYLLEVKTASESKTVKVRKF